MMNVYAIIQARMTSTRLPGKVLKEICGKPMLAHLIGRLQRTESLDGIMIATTTNEDDDPIASLTDELGVPYHRGSEHDVLKRMLEAAEKTKADAIVRITGDCPLIDPDVVNRVIEEFLILDADYVSNARIRSYPIGMDVAVVSRSALEEADRNATVAEEREHVTPYIFRHPERFRLGNVTAPKALHDPQLRLTLDTPEDLELIRYIYETLYPTNTAFTLADIMLLIGENPSIRDLNSQVKHRWIDTKS